MVTSLSASVSKTEKSTCGRRRKARSARATLLRAAVGAKGKNTDHENDFAFGASYCATGVEGVYWSRESHPCDLGGSEGGGARLNGLHSRCYESN